MAAVEIHDPKTEWAGEFRALARLLRATLGARVVDIHHIGSTSVPGLGAKDVIDIQATVAALEDDAGLRKALSVLGFSAIERVTGDHLPPGATDPSRWAKRLFKLQEPRAVNLHVRVQGWPNARYAILFRDYLRATPAAARGYEAAKRRLAAEHAEDLGAYTDLKDVECDRVMEAAKRWAEETSWQVPASEA